jgi:hypothetical protein
MKDCLDERCKFLPLERKLSLFDPISWGHLLEIIQRANGSRTTQVTEASSLENVFFFFENYSSESFIGTPLLYPIRFPPCLE